MAPFPPLKDRGELTGSSIDDPGGVDLRKAVMVVWRGALRGL